METWKSIKGYEDYYEVSDAGRVRSLQRIEITTGRYGQMKRRRKGTVLKLNNRNGYRSVELNKNGNIKRENVHRLVASAFIREIRPDETIHHIDKNKKNNKVSNLQILTQKEHISIHSHAAWNRGLKGYRAGEKRDRHIYDKLRKRIKCTESGEIFGSIVEAANHINKKSGTVIAALKNNKRTAGGFHFEYC